MSKPDPDFIYRPPTDGEESAHAHEVRRTTLKQLYAERVAEDGTVVGPESRAGKHLILSRDELSRYGSAYHGNLRERFYLDRDEAEAA